MSQVEVLKRYSAIIAKLKKAPATLKEIGAHLAFESDLHGYDLKFSKRNFLRDRADMLSLFQISVVFCSSKKKYVIEGEHDENLNDRILEAFDTLNALNSSVGFSNYVDLEKRKSTGYHNFHGILHAIKNREVLGISYQSYWDANASLRTLEPYLLKEFKNRWYLIAKDLAKNELRTYGLDRIKEFHFSKKKFSYPKTFDPETHFKDSFGIIRKDSDKPVQEVILSFQPHQGSYLKSLPLHPSQQIVKDNEKELMVTLKIYVTLDFVMELLSFGPSVEVLKPDFLRETVVEKLKTSLSLYGEEI